MNTVEELTSILRPFGQAVVDVYKAAEFRIAGITFNLFQLILWGVIACFLIDRIKEIVDC